MTTKNKGLSRFSHSLRQLELILLCADETCWQNMGVPQMVVI
jgi:hypothetical protein